MMSANMIGGISGSVLGNAEMLVGYYKAKKNKKELEEIEKNRPWYVRPEEANQYLEQAKTNANSNILPGQSRYEENIEQATAANTRNIKELSESPTASLGAMNDAYQRQMDAISNLSLQQAQYFQSNQDRLANAFRESAKYSDMEFEYNVNAPWMRKYQNKINEYQSNRNIMQMGMSTWANASSNFGGSQGMSQPMQEPRSNINYNNMYQDANNSNNWMDNSGDYSNYGGYS